MNWKLLINVITIVLYVNNNKNLIHFAIRMLGIQKMIKLNLIVFYVQQRMGTYTNKYKMMKNVNA